MIGVIKGTGSCVPGKVVTNDDIAGLVETSDGWIRERTGIEERHIATEETCVELAQRRPGGRFRTPEWMRRSWI